LSAELRPLLIDGEFARLVTSLSGLVDLNPNNKVLRPQLITRLTHLTFDERDQERVRGMIGFGLGYKPSAWQHYANILASNEWPVQPEGKEFARKAIGISYMVGYHYQEGSVTSFSTSYQDYLYQKEFTGSDELRSSTLFYATLKHEWAITDASEFNAMYRYVEGASNIDFFDYQRNFMRIGYAYKF
ncbi:MAG: hypothetical protein P1U57_05300, partial [Oleibacter sp.]|nr:hypothetical protein [Thalassolituus sp.]